MNALELLNNIFETNTVADENGNSFPLNSNLDQEEGQFLQKIIKEHEPVKTIEVGCAYGISSLYICSALQAKKEHQHTIIDPFQSSDWRNIGRNHLKIAGIENFEIIEVPSELALPKLLSEKKKFDFGFIDGWHTFDHTLIDFFYLNRMINVGGVIVIDDVGLPSVNKFMRYILNYPAYKVIGNVAIDVSKKRKLFNTLISTPFKLLAKLFPKKVQTELFGSKILHSDDQLKIKSSMLAIKKIKEDERPWDWYKDF